MAPGDRHHLHESTRDRLRRLALFAELEDEALDRLAGLSRILHLERKTTLYGEGEAYRGMFVVLDGLVVVYRISEDGRMLILDVCRPGDSLADVPLFEEREAGLPGARPRHPRQRGALPAQGALRALPQAAPGGCLGDAEALRRPRPRR